MYAAPQSGASLLKTFGIWIVLAFVQIPLWSAAEWLKNYPSLALVQAAAKAFAALLPWVAALAYLGYEIWHRFSSPGGDHTRSGPRPGSLVSGTTRYIWTSTIRSSPSF